MSLKITEQGRKYLVRRWSYVPEKKRSMPTTVYKVLRYEAPSELPEDVIKEFNITDEEHQNYIDFMGKTKKESLENRAKMSLRGLRYSLESARVALENSELRNEINLKEYEELSETIGEIKKLITKNKNALRAKARKEA